MTKRADTSGTTIAIAFLVMNLETLLQIHLRLFAGLWRWAVMLLSFVVARPQAGSTLVA